MTGESEPASKEGNDPWLIAHTNVVNGMGKMLVGATGPNCEWGRTLKKMQEGEGEDTPLQEQLEQMVVAIGKVALLMGGLTFVILAIYWELDTYYLVLKSGWEFSFLRGFVDALVIGITLLVVGIPEGLPLAVIISLAYSMKAMTKDNILVRHIEACETMGGATNICSDKTGTLTQNMMTVMEGWVTGQNFGKVPWKEGEVQIAPSVWEMLRLSIALNSTALRQRSLDKTQEKPKVVGSPTEMALLDMVDKVDGSEAYYEKVRKENEPQMILQIPFSSETKRMTSVFYIPDLDVVRQYVKGAPEQLISDCELVATGEGQMMPVSPSIRAEMEEVVSRLTGQGFRVIFVGFRDVPAAEFVSDSGRMIESIKESYVALRGKAGALVALGIFGIEDPVRPEVPEAIMRCVHAGITVRMVTGDYLGTAVKIAEQCGIKTKKGVVMTGNSYLHDSLFFFVICIIIILLLLLSFIFIFFCLLFGYSLQEYMNY